MSTVPVIEKNPIDVATSLWDMGRFQDALQKIESLNEGTKEEAFLEVCSSEHRIVDNANAPTMLAFVEKQKKELKNEFLFTSAAQDLALRKEGIGILNLVKNQHEDRNNILVSIGFFLFSNKNSGIAQDSLEYAASLSVPEQIKIFSNEKNVRAALMADKPIFLAMFKNLKASEKADIIKQPGTARALAEVGEVALVIEVLEKNPEIQVEILSHGNTVSELVKKDKNAAERILRMLASKKKGEKARVLTSSGAATGFVEAGLENELLKMVGEQPDEVKQDVVYYSYAKDANTPSVHNRLQWVAYEIMKDTPPSKERPQKITSTASLAIFVP